MTAPAAKPAPPRVALVTGAADGIGLAVTRNLVAAGAAVGMVDVNGERLAASVGRLREDGHRVLGFTASVSDEPAVEAALGEVEAAFGPVDTVSSNVGIAPYGELLTLRKADWEAVLDPNLTGTFVVTTVAARAMVASATRGAIVCMASGAAFGTRVGGGRYSTSKAGVVMLTKALAVELGRYGIRVNGVAPGLINHGYREGLGHFVTDEYAERARRATPLDRVPTAQDVADVVSYLVSPLAAFVSGEVVRVDGAAGAGRYDSPWSGQAGEVDA